MERLREFIEINKKDFECENLPAGHKMRFYIRMHSKPLTRISAAAAILILLLVTPLIYQSYFNHNPDKYAAILKNRETQITTIALKLDDRGKEQVLNTLDQLVNDVVTIEEQLPDVVVNEKRDEIISNYYKAKIEGADKLLAYASKLK